ncbi:MAG: hypothetical protein AABX63_03145 [Nanoarchaeota archaeon]
MDNGHYLHEQTFFSYNYKVAMEKGTLPFWTPYWYSGQPLYGDSQVFFLNLTHIFILLFDNIFLAINLSTLFYLFIAGLGMYVLMMHLVSARSAAFISSLVYMFNGLIYQFVTIGNPTILEPYSLIPLIFLFVLKAKKSKNPLPYSILAGMLLAFQIFSGGAIIFTYTLLLLGLFLALDLPKRKFAGSLIKTAVIGLVLIAVLFGLSAVKLLPNLDFVQKTNRASGVSYQEYIGEDKFALNDFFDAVVFNRPSQSITAHIGIAAFLLVAFSIGMWRKKMVFFLIAISAFAVFLASGGLLAELFYKYVPVFSQTRHIGRVIFIFMFVGSILAGYGLTYISHTLLQKFRLWSRIKNLVFIILVLLILSELVLVKGLPQAVSIRDQLEDNSLAKYLQVEKGKFRITTFDVDDLISFFGSSYYAQYGLETISGGGGLWINDFIRYLATAKAYNNSKLLGILNLKYATSLEKRDVAGFKEIRKFEECAACNESDWTFWIGGPYLYENENFLPRYYIVNNSVLIVGDDKEVQNLAYAVLLNKNFNPKTMVIIRGKDAKINDYEIGFIKKFDAIILLAGSVDESSLPLLEQYKGSGGKILPDIFSNKVSFDFSEIENTLAAFNGELVEVSSETISNNEIVLKPANKGFVVLSEKFAMFDDWSAAKNGKDVKILQADAVISSVYADSPGDITFKFSPKSFRKGLAISLITLLIITAYWIYLIRRRWKNKNAS